LSEIIYNRIAVLRAERGISRRQLAEALGVHYQTVGYLERGEYSPSLYLALRLAEYFEVPVEVVFSTEPFPRIGSAERSVSLRAAHLAAAVWPGFVAADRVGPLMVALVAVRWWWAAAAMNLRRVNPSGY
jgi:putative transcriptional regulator